VQTVSIPLKFGLRWGQKYPYKSPDWQKAYDLRTTVERKNSQLKHNGFEDLNNPLNRPARGYAANALAVAMIATAHNIRTVNTYLRTAEGIETSRSPRRRDVLKDVAKQRDGRTRK